MKYPPTPTWVDQAENDAIARLRGRGGQPENQIADLPLGRVADQNTRTHRIVRALLALADRLLDDVQTMFLVGYALTTKLRLRLHWRQG